MKTDIGKIVKKNGKYYKLVTPDGGWGYAIAVGMVIVMVSVTAPMGCYGMIYSQFFENAGISVSGAGLQNGIVIFCFSVACFMTSIALKQFSLRQVGLFGATLYGLGCFGGIFMDSLLTFIVSGGILAGSGGGVMFACSLTAFNVYFDKQKVFCMSICQTVISIVSMLFPLLINTCMAELGFRGTMAILCAISLQNIVAFALHQSVDQHLVLEPLSDSDAKELEPLNAKEKEALGNEVLTQPQVTREKVVNSITIKVPKSKMHTLVETLDLPLLKDPVFLNIGVGLAIALTADVTFLNLLPLHLYQSHWTNDQVAFVMTCILVGDTSARALLAIFSKFYTVSGRALFMGGVFFMAMLRFVMFIPQDVVTVTALSAALGFCRSSLLVTPPLILADHVPTEKFAAAQGLQMLMMGVLSCVAGPIAGAIRDSTGSYVITFHTLTAGMLVCLFSWLVEIMVMKARRNKKINNNV